MCQAKTDLWAHLCYCLEIDAAYEEGEIENKTHIIVIDL